MAVMVAQLVRLATALSVLCGCLVASSHAAALRRPSVRAVVASNVDGSYSSVYQLGNCPTALRVSGTAPSPAHGGVAAAPVNGISIDGAACAGAPLTVVSSDIAQDPKQLAKVGFGKVAAQIAANGAANATINGGFDQAEMTVGFFGQPVTCGKYTLPADSFIFFLTTAAGSSQDITITSPAGVAQTTTIPAKSNAAFMTGGDSLCIAADRTRKRGGEADPAVVPEGTPGSIASIFDQESAVPADEAREVSIANNTAGNAACFPAAAEVELLGGQLVAMSSLRVGHSVKTGVNSYSDVILFTHREPDAVYEFIEITTAGGHTIALSANHYLHVAALGRLVPAGRVKVGDALLLSSSGTSSLVVRTGTVRRRGLYNPQTIDGNIGVDGVIASTYTTAVHPRLARSALVPVRWLYKAPFQGTRSFLGSLFPNGSPLAASLLPSGPSLLMT
jgi:Hint module